MVLQVGSGFQQMGCPAVTNQMGCHRLAGCFGPPGQLLLQARHTVLSVIGCSESRCMREGTRYVCGWSHSQ